MSTVVYHIRMKDFELQAERTLDPALRTRPVAIISSHRQDGTVMALSAEAQVEGLFRGMKVSPGQKDESQCPPVALQSCSLCPPEPVYLFHRKDLYPNGGALRLREILLGYDWHGTVVR